MDIIVILNKGGRGNGNDGNKKSGTRTGKREDKDLLEGISKLTSY